MIRPATLEDFNPTLAVIREAFTHTPFHGKVEMNENHVKRTFANAVVMPHMFNWVSVDDDDLVRGVLLGVIHPNAWGAPIATDLINYSNGDTHKLIREFRHWAKTHGVAAMSLTTETNNERLERLIERMGSPSIGHIHLEIF